LKLIAIQSTAHGFSYTDL